MFPLQFLFVCQKPFQTMTYGRAATQVSSPEVDSGWESGGVKTLLLRKRCLQRLRRQVCCRKPEVAAACQEQIKR